MQAKPLAWVRNDQPRHCFHCGEAITELGRFSAIDGTMQPMCPRLQAIAETIVASGLKDYYQHRTSCQPLAARARRQRFARAIPAVFTTATPAKAVCRQTRRFLRSQLCYRRHQLRHMHSWLIEKRMAQLPGVSQARLNLSTIACFTVAK